MRKQVRVLVEGRPLPYVVWADTGLPLSREAGHPCAIVEVVAKRKAPEPEKVPEPKKEAKAKGLSLPLTDGQMVRARNGRVGCVETVGSGATRVAFAKTREEPEESWYYHTETGIYCGREDDPDQDHQWKLVEDATDTPRLELPVKDGQRVQLLDGKLATIENRGYGNDIYNLRFDDGRVSTSAGYYESGCGWRDRRDHHELVVFNVNVPPKQSDTPNLTLPLTFGQSVVCRDGKVRTVMAIAGNAVRFDDNEWVFIADGRGSVMDDKPYDAISDAPKAKRTRKAKKAKLTLPLMVGQKVRCKDGVVRVVKEVFGSNPTIARYDDGIVTNAANGRCAGKDSYGGGGYSLNAVEDVA